jgi:hypothetical protein
MNAEKVMNGLCYTLVAVSIFGFVGFIYLGFVMTELFAKYGP